jgi:ubiquinone/menaquinone biosynthesis C-methylase UbiE
MTGHRFDPSKLARLNDPERLVDLDPGLLLRAAGVQEATSVLEVGAGTGLFATAFARRLPGSVVYAADVSPEMVEWMCGHLGAADLEQVTPLLSDALALPLADDAIDLVTMINVHHEFDDARAALREARRVLRPGGVLLIADWRPEPMPKGPPLEHRVAEETIREDVALAGLVDIVSHPGLPYHNLVTAAKG